jgi:FkbM family methyltransferase
MNVRSGIEIFNKFSPFDVLKDASGLVVDVGAAAGVVTKKMLSFSPHLRCLAIEPFNGNHPYLEKNCGNDLRVKIIKAALSDSNGVKKFKVGATVTGEENGWENYIGYSSGGKLVCDESVGGVIDVDVARLDDIAEQIPFFIKIDVQGGELEVLKGAEKLLLKGGVRFFV